MAGRYTIQCSLPNTHTLCTLNWRAGGRQAGKDGGWGGGGSKGSVREGGSGSGGRVEEGNEWGEGN